ncbi:MerR family transcriptional regulator [Acinetobacter nematophilus]|uniref:MerR family transcriptional regulator n=1 Tax=Acinetobacter nematophilus TaxID=2994642 RepID=UPI003AF445C1
MNLAKVAALTQVSPRMLRYYEELGLIHPLRTANHYRFYNQQDIENIRKIKVLNHAGMHLKDIKRLLPCFDLGEEKFTLCPVVKQALNRELKNISEKISKLKQSQDLLKSFLIMGKGE